MGLPPFYVFYEKKNNARLVENEPKKIFGKRRQRNY